MTLRQRQRIEAYSDSKTHKARRERQQAWMFAITLSGVIAFVIGAVLMIAMSGGIETEYQLQAYKAQQHQAVELEFPVDGKLATK